MTAGLFSLERENSLHGNRHKVPIRAVLEGVPHDSPMDRLGDWPHSRRLWKTTARQTEADSCWMVCQGSQTTCQVRGIPEITS